jgi:hypothetical protein
MPASGAQIPYNRRLAVTRIRSPALATVSIAVMRLYGVPGAVYAGVVRQNVRIRLRNFPGEAPFEGKGAPRLMVRNSMRPELQQY